MSILSSHVAFAYRLADSQCHNNNEIKRNRSKSLFTFNCNIDESSLDSNPSNNAIKYSSNCPGYVKTSHRRPTRDHEGPVLNKEQVKGDSNPSDLILRFKERRMRAGKASHVTTGKQAVSAALTCLF